MNSQAIALSLSIWPSVIEFILSIAANQSLQSIL